MSFYSDTKHPTERWTPNGRLQAYTAPEGDTITYAYDPAGRLLSLTLPGQGQITYNRYQIFRVRVKTLESVQRYTSR